MNKFTCIAILILLPNINYAGEWYAIGDVKINEKTTEENLWGYLNKKSTKKLKARETYSYQYTAKNNNNIYINAFCNKWSRENLNKELLVIKDGGSCYFQINYNQKTGQFTELRINGEA